MLERLAAREDRQPPPARRARPRAAAAPATWPSEPVPPVTTTRLPSSKALPQSRVLVGASAASSATISASSAARSRLPRGGGCESRLRSITTDVVRLDLDLELERVAKLREQVVLGDRLGAQVPQPVQLLMALDDVGDRAGENRRRRSAEHSPRESSHRAARLAPGTTRADHGPSPARGRSSMSGSSGPRVSRLAEQLRAAVRVHRVGKVALHVAAGLPGEDAVGGDVDQADLPLAARGGELVREERVDADRRLGYPRRPA